MSEVTEPTAKKAGLWHRLYHGETSFNFIGRRNIWFIASAIVILIGLGGLFTKGLNQGIDFKGGTAWEVRSAGVSVAKARDALRPLGLGDANITTIHGSGGTRLRIEADTASTDTRDKVTTKLGELTHGNQVSVDEVGPTWGKNISHKAQRALVFFFLAIALYISLRFEWKMALAALAAVVHDILVTLGIYSLSGFQVTPATVVAFLTILGYSLYDTIVVFDKVEENTRGLAASGRMTYGDTVNLSMNQVLMRSLNTSLVAILPILSVLVVGAYILGATALEDFGLALFVGLLTGAYSSIFIASPLLAMLKEREPRYATIRQRAVARGGIIGAPLTPAAAAAMSGGGGAGGGGGAVSVDRDSDGPPLKPGMGAPERVPAGRPASRPTGGNRPAPRPRKKGKRR